MIADGDGHLVVDEQLSVANREVAWELYIDDA